MSGVNYKDILKKGWHPEKEGTSLRGQIKGLVGRGDTDETQRSHVARPISSLRDPSSFGPPPARQPRTGSPAGTPSPPISRPMSTSSSTSPYRLPQAGEPIATEEAPAPLKQYRVNTTGLSTSNLPPPPIRRDSTGGSQTSAPPVSATPPKLPPKLPPRLPPRSTVPQKPLAAPPALPTRADSPGSPMRLNQGAIDRLGAAGIKVPGFGIGTSSTASGSSQAQTLAPPPPFTDSPGADQLNKLQSRFSRLGNSQSQPSPTPDQGTLLEQKRAAVQTAAAFRQDPSAVSLSDARAAASTANNFRQRHGEQVSTGLRSPSSLYGKYGGRVNQHDGNEENSMGQAASAAALLAKKKPAPPPPPPKRFGGGSGGETPPPVPLATRPQF